MSILTDRDIKAAMARGEIKITPFNERSLGTNSYDVHLSPYVGTYVADFDGDNCELPLDVAVHRPIKIVEMDESYLMLPGELYLCSTIEYTESHMHVPFLEGKSSLGRLGLSIHITAGKGDVGFCNHWTMEMTVIKPLIVRAGMPVGQLLWHTIASPPLTTYKFKTSAKYNARSGRPCESMMHKNFVGNGRSIL